MERYLSHAFNLYLLLQLIYHNYLEGSVETQRKKDCYGVFEGTAPC